MSLETTLVLAPIVLLGYLVQTVTGFGAMLVCVSLGAVVITIPELIPSLIPLSLLQTGYIVLRHRRDIEWDLLVARIVPVMGAGVLVGMFLFRELTGAWMAPAFGVMVLVLAARELWILLRADRMGPRKIPWLASIAALFGAGVTHGMFASGGPLLVYATSREGLDKNRFRTTLSMVWVVLNVAMVAGFAWDGSYDAARLEQLGVLVIAVPFGIAFGEWVHRKVDERRFKIGVFGLLIAAGGALLLK